MFKITDGKGFHITFANGWTASVQWGMGNYCQNYAYDLLRSDAEVAAMGSKTAEIAARDSDGTMYDFGGHQFKGYVTPNEVLMFLNMVAGF